MRSAAVGWLSAMALAACLAARTSPASPPEDSRQPASGEAVASPRPGDARGAPSLAVVVTPEAPTVGDRVIATLVVTGLPPGAAEPRFPVWQGEWGDAEVLDVHAPAPAGDGWRQQVVLAFFAPGARRLPVVSVQVPDPETTRTVALEAPVTVTVRSVLPEDENAEPAPPAPPRPLPLGSTFLWLAAGLAASCLGAAVVLARRRTEDRIETDAPRLSPLEELRDRLAETDPAAEPTRAWEAATGALRRFLARTLDFRAVESTTLQIHRVLSRRLSAELSQRAVRLLRAADQIKFARGSASSTSAQGAVAEIGRLGEDIDRHLRPEPAPGEESA